MKDFGDHVTEGQTDPQYMFLAQRLSALDDGWHELLQMWDNRQQALSQSLNLQVNLSCLCMDNCKIFRPCGY